MKTLKAIDWLNENGIAFTFHDIRKMGVSAEKIDEWNSRAGFEKFLNKHIPTWTHLYPRERELAVEACHALKLMGQKLSLIKRPVIESGRVLYFGFSDEDYRREILGESGEENSE